MRLADDESHATYPIARRTRAHEKMCRRVVVLVSLFFIWKKFWIFEAFSQAVNVVAELEVNAFPFISVC